jgi:hypothetical protein
MAPGGFNQDMLPTAGVGCTDVVVLDASDKNVVPDISNCHYFQVDVSGIVKIDFQDQTGEVKTEVLQANAGTPCLRRNIVKLYQNYAKDTPITAHVFKQNGTLVRGIKLCR